MSQAAAAQRTYLTKFRKDGPINAFMAHPLSDGRMGLTILLTMVLAFTVEGHAAEPGLVEQASEKSPSTYDRIWKRFQLYKNGDNRVIQSLTLSGRFQLDYAVVDAEEGHDDEWNIRRFRFGAKAQLFHRFTVHGEVELNPQERDPLYVRITDLYLEWSRTDRFRATFGKHAAPFTMDGSTSSKELLAVDRSNLTNNLWFTLEYFPGVSIEGEHNAWDYHAGLYSSGSINREFGNFDGSVFALGVVGYDFAERLKVKGARLAGNYVYQHPDIENTFTRRLEHIVSLNLELETDTWGLRTDLAAADGHLGDSNIWGAMAMPYYSFGGGFQLVGRYTYVKSTDVNGVRLGAYENRVVPQRGDEFNELYLGLNYYFYGHKLKVQTGVQFAEMMDRANDGGAYSGVGWTTGLRVSW
jgi:phosphate-selective porin OprO/OprP